MEDRNTIKKERAVEQRKNPYNLVKEAEVQTTNNEVKQEAVEAARVNTTKKEENDVQESSSN